ncbi:hypothetical protein HK405_000059 [Cladochytrium tenue]|nr:hypothetical protein HK405_000059 [Cladochytrium tenue]
MIDGDTVVEQGKGSDLAATGAAAAAAAVAAVAPATASASTTVAGAVPATDTRKDNTGWENLAGDGGGKLLRRVLARGEVEDAEATTTEVTEGCLVAVHYVGRLRKTGEQFDASRDRGPRPFEFVVGRGDVIRGWERGLLGLRAGDRAELVCGPEYAYGSTGNPPTIPPDATLAFEVEVISCRAPEDPVASKLERADAHKAAGTAHFQAGRFAAAAAAYAAGLDALTYTWGAAPGEAARATALRQALQLNAAAALLRAGDARGAADACARVLEKDPASIKALYRLGLARAELGELDAAEEALGMAQKIDPDDPAIERELARVAEKKVQDAEREKKLYRAMFGRA